MNIDSQTKKIRGGPISIQRHIDARKEGIDSIIHDDRQFKDQDINEEDNEDEDEDEYEGGQLHEK
jgi:hypothetical protein